MTENHSCAADLEEPQEIAVPYYLRRRQELIGNRRRKPLYTDLWVRDAAQAAATAQDKQDAMRAAFKRLERLLGA